MIWLSEFTTAADAVAAGEAIVDPEQIMPKVRFDDEGKMVGVVMPWDPDYDSL